MARIAIVGAGAMGSYFAARLSRASHELVVIDVDGERLELIARHGIAVSDDSGDWLARVEAGTADKFSGSVDLLIVFTKGMHTHSAARSVSHLVGNQTTVLTLQNGLGNDVLLAEILGSEKVVMGMTDVPADLTGANSVASHGQAQVVLGPYHDAGGPLAIEVANVLRSGGYSVEVDPKVRIQIWEKVAFNAAMNSASAVTGLTVGQLDSTAGRDLIDRLWNEVADVADAQDLKVDRSRIAKKVRNALDHHGSHKPSMLQDVLAGRRTEIENINGAVVRLGEQRNVSVAANRVMALLVRTIEASR